MTTETKFCKDCKHAYIMHLPIRFGSLFCKSPNLSRSVVTGEVQTRSCEGLRHHQYSCGKDAKWFEPKPQKLGFFGFIKKLVH